MPVDLLGQVAEHVEPFIQPVKQDGSGSYNTLEYGCLRQTRLAKASAQFPALAPVFVVWDETKRLLRFKQLDGAVTVSLVACGAGSLVTGGDVADSRKGIPAYVRKTEIRRWIAELDSGDTIC